MTGGCITKLWGKALDVSERVLDLLSKEPELTREFERLYRAHDRRLPRLLPWGRSIITHHQLGARRTASILTSCTKKRGLQSSCWYVGQAS